MDLKFFIARHGFVSILPLKKEQEPIREHLYLWRKVIDQALHDTSSKEKKVLDMTKKWFNINEPSFVQVCNLAEINCEELVKLYHEVLVDCITNSTPIQVVKTRLDKQDYINKLIKPNPVPT